MNNTSCEWEERFLEYSVYLSHAFKIDISRSQSDLDEDQSD